MPAFGNSTFARVEFKISRTPCPPLSTWHGSKGDTVAFSRWPTTKSDSPEVTLVALWDSLQAIRASENNLFLTQAISRFLACCEGLPHITEQEVLASDFVATTARARTLLCRNGEKIPYLRRLAPAPMFISASRIQASQRLEWECSGRRLSRA